MRKLLFVLATTMVMIYTTGTAFAQESAPAGNSAASALENFGVRGGIGTDINGGLAFGGGINYLAFGRIEIGGYIYKSHFEESTDENGHTYDETTDTLVFGALANYLGGYEKDRTKFIYLAGWGLGIFNVQWEETSKTDSSLGEPYGLYGSRMSAEGTAAGTIFNLGAGVNFSNNVDVRFEVPMFLIFSAPGDASAFIPTFTLTAGYRF